jgi:hypothetical protein
MLQAIEPLESLYEQFLEDYFQNALKDTEDLYRKMQADEAAGQEMDPGAREVLLEVHNEMDQVSHDLRRRAGYRGCPALGGLADCFIAVLSLASFLEEHPHVVSN